MRAIAGLLFAAGLFALYIFVARWLFVHANIWLDVVYPLLALSVDYIALTVYSYLGEQRQRRQIKGMFRQYVAPVVVEEMLKDPSRVKLGGDEKVLTVLFSDLEGFTTHSERYAPQADGRHAQRVLRPDDGAGLRQPGDAQGVHWRRADGHLRRAHRAGRSRDAGVRGGPRHARRTHGAGASGRGSAARASGLGRGSTRAPCWSGTSGPATASPTASWGTT